MQKSTTIALILYQCLRVSCLAGTLGQKQLAVHGILMQFSSFVYMVSELYSHNRGKTLPFNDFISVLEKPVFQRQKERQISLENSIL